MSLKIKYILFVILALSFSEVKASLTHSHSSGGDVFISRNFDYVIACDLKYKKVDDGNYEYFCPNPPNRDETLFMSTIFDDGHWPSKIIYYMGFK